MTRRTTGRRVASKRKSLQEIGRELAKAYPDAACALDHRNAFELLVATILSAQCTDVRVNMVTPRLFDRYPTPKKLAAADRGDLEEIIRSTGFYRSKARSLLGMAAALEDRFGGDVPRSMVELTSLPGVGRKTANVVLGVSFGIPGFPVDTHVTRLLGRLGITRSSDPVAIEKEVCSLLPPGEWTSMSLRLILHGRAICMARRPKCSQCVLAELCPSAFDFPSKRSS